MKRLFTLLFVLFTASQTFAQTTVTFNVDLNDTITSGWFDPAVDSVYMAGDIFDPAWQMPGTDQQTKMSDDDNDGIYTLTLSNVADGTYNYKYFKATAAGATWDNGEWSGDPNRTLTIPVVAKTVVTVDDKFGDVNSHAVASSVNHINSTNLTISPNPSTGIFYLNSDLNFRVMNIAGKVVLSGKSNQIDLTGFAKGMYFVKFETNEIRKIIVQ